MSDGPQLPRGRRFCVTCGDLTRHASTEHVSSLGKTLIVVAALVTASLYVHNAVRWSSIPEPAPAAATQTRPADEPLHDRTSAADEPVMDLGSAFLFWSLPLVVGVILTTLGLRRRSFRVRCKACGAEEERRSPPHWTHKPTAP